MSIILLEFLRMKFPRIRCDGVRLSQARPIMLCSICFMFVDTNNEDFFTI